MKEVLHEEKIIAGQTEIWFDEEGILRLKPFVGTDLELKDVMACFEVYKKWGCDKQKVLQLIDAREHVSMTHEGRKYAAEHGKHFFIASAVISNSLAVRLIVNFFNSFYEQPVPFKLFGTEEEALKWLRKFRK